jgi:hypothetical protein
MRSAASWVLAIALAVPALACADELTAQKRADIRELIGASGGTKITGQLADVTSKNISSALKRQHPDLPEGVAAKLRTELITLFEERANVPGGLVDRIVASYHKHFTHPEIKELLAFNQTPIGRKTMQVLPAIMSETMTAGQAWGQALAPEVQRRVNAVLKKEGIAPQKKK